MSTPTTPTSPPATSASPPATSAASPSIPTPAQAIPAPPHATPAPAHPHAIPAPPADPTSPHTAPASPDTAPSPHLNSAPDASASDATPLDTAVANAPAPPHTAAFDPPIPGSPPSPNVASSDEALSSPAPPATIPALDAPSHLNPDSDRLARLALNHAVEPADPLIGRILTRHSPADVLAAIHADQLADLDPDPARRDRLVDRCTGLKLRLEPGQVESGIATADAVGARFVVPGDRDWPPQLDDLDELRPIGIWVVGRWPPTPLDAPTRTRDTPGEAAPAAARVLGMVTAGAPTMPGTPGTPETSGTAGSPGVMMSVVGARACTGYGAYIAGTIGADLASAQVAVVSGAALGIDAAAHRGALAVGGPTLAVLACGIDRVYPRGHEVLLRAIAERGAVLSELPPGASPTRFRFLHRNRIIAALGTGTVVVEAARRSGSLVTARLAAELGRVVMAVPGPVTSDQSTGTHELIRDGATLVIGAAQAREACASLTDASLIAREAARAEAPRSDRRPRAGQSGRRAQATSSGAGTTAAASVAGAESAASGVPNDEGLRGARPEAATPERQAEAGSSGERSEERSGERRGAAGPTDPVEELVLEALPTARGVVGSDVLTLARATGLRPDAVFAALGRLAAAGRVIRAGGGWMLAPPE